MRWRTQPLPPDWARRRERVLIRDRGVCQVEEDGEICGRRAGGVDHIVPASRGGGDEDENLQAICDAHHRIKTGREGRAARVIPQREREPEPHPGLIG